MRLLAWRVLFSCATTLAASSAQGVLTTPSLDAAVSQLQAGDASGAAKTLRLITAAEPGNGAAWRALGASDMALREYTAAIHDYRRSLQIEPNEPKVFYQLGAAYASQRNTNEAFKWLEKAHASRRYDMTEISEDV